MRKLIYGLVLMLALATPVSMSGCATLIGPPESTVVLTPVEKAQDVATKSVLTMGAIFATAPGMIKTARDAGKISKDTYNNTVDIYNQALASYILLNKALQAAIEAGQDPTATTGYQTALTKFLLDKSILDNLIIAMGEKPLGVK